jgi:polysaccharide export outer membrane protein
MRHAFFGRVYGEEDLSQEVRVTTGGYITYPLLGRIKASGMSVMELEDALMRSLAKDYIRNPEVQVFVKEFSNIYVFGQVKEPGPCLFKGGMTAVQAITTAGGFSKIANPRKVRIVRTHHGERQVIQVNVSAITNGDEEDILLQPGDTVVVPESFF